MAAEQAAKSAAGLLASALAVLRATAGVATLAVALAVAAGFLRMAAAQQTPGAPGLLAAIFGTVLLRTTVVARFLGRSLVTTAGRRAFLLTAAATEHSVQQVETEALGAQAEAQHHRCNENVPLHRAMSPLRWNK
jgi:hypothetical protein